MELRDTQKKIFFSLMCGAVCRSGLFWCDLFGLSNKMELDGTFSSC